MEWILNHLDIASKTAVVIIAACNLFFSVKFFQLKNEKDDIDKEKDRKIQWLKTLILDHNLKHFYAFFDELETELNRLKESGLSNEDKKCIENGIADKFVILRIKFIDMLLAIDNDMYVSFLDLSDELQGHISTSIFDTGINLDNKDKFKEVVESKVMATKTEFIKRLFTYRG